MALAANRGFKSALWLIALLAAIVAGGEVLLELMVEAADLVLEGSQAVLLLIFERAFGLPYARAEGLAAWTSLGVLALCMAVAVWRLTPWVKAKAAASRRRVRETRAAMTGRWRAARWYQKSLAVIALLVVLSALLMVV